MPDAAAINWGSVADWVSGLGSLSAGLIALYLARSAERIKLKGYCGIRMAIGGGAPKEELLWISATNIGPRAAVVTTISMRVGRWKRRQAILTVPRDQYSVGTPIKLEDGQEAHWGFPLGQADAWLRDLCSKFVLTKGDVDTLRFRLHTSHGVELVLKPEAELKTRLLRLLQSDDG